MTDIKKKICEILFEEDESEVDDSEKKPIIKEVKKVEEVINNEGPQIKAKDFLYRKSDVFVDLNDNKKPSNYSDNNEAYVFSSQISPIFGVIKQDKKQETESELKVNKKLTSKPADAHLDIITSPIYGYGSDEDNKNAIDDLVEDKQELDEEELHDLFDNEEKNDSLDKLEDDEEITLFKLFGDK